jgi:hypothetical protein
MSAGTGLGDARDHTNAKLWQAEGPQREGGV